MGARNSLSFVRKRSATPDRPCACTYHVSCLVAIVATENVIAHDYMASAPPMSSASWRTAPRPSSAGLDSFNHTKLVLKYKPAPCGIDSNLLLLLHGLGDTADPFFSLGQRLQQTLPQTAVLSVQAPLRVPLLEEEAWMWYDSFDALGEGTFACPSVQDKSVSCCRMTPGIVSCLPTAFVPHATYTLARTIRLFWPNFTNGTQCA